MNDKELDEKCVCHYQNSILIVVMEKKNHFDLSPKKLLRSNSAPELNVWVYRSDIRQNSPIRSPVESPTIKRSPNVSPIMQNSPLKRTYSTNIPFTVVTKTVTVISTEVTKKHRRPSLFEFMFRSKNIERDNRRDSLK